MKFAQQTCSPQSNTLNKQKVNNWSVLANPKQNMTLTQFCAHCTLWLSSHKASKYHLQHEWQWLNSYFSVSSTNFYQLLLTVNNNLHILAGILPLGNWICSQFDLHHFHHLWEWQFLPIPCNCASLLMTFSTFGKFWNPSSKRNNVPHNKTLILACQYCKCWHLTKSWPVSTGFLILVACTQSSSPKDDFPCFLLNQMLLGNLCFSFWLIEKDCNGKMFISMVYF